MGLGKTIQAIAAIEILARHFGVSKVLVICPTSLKYQWQSEIRRFSGRDSRIISGGRALRQADYAHDDFCKATNYEKLQPDLDLIAAWAPELVIVDEAQRVKNWNTIAARALKRIDSPYAMVLTGTPLENKLEELISIVQEFSRRRGFGKATGAGRALSRRSRLPGIPFHRCRRHRPQPAARLHAGQHGPAMESRDPRTA
jgi:SNF2 family DNA or RNA helicase